MDKNFRDMLEWKWQQIQTADWVDAPFPMDEDEARIWNEARRTLMQWVIEMMPPENSAP